MLWLDNYFTSYPCSVCFLPGLFSERQRAPCHPAGPNKSHESFPEEPQRTSGGEIFSPNPGRCHCHGARWPITHGTWTDGKESNHLFCHVSSSSLSPHSSLFLYFLAAWKEWGSLGDGQQWTAPTHPHTHTHRFTLTHTYSPFLCIIWLLLCPELTVHAQRDHPCYTQPAGSLAVPHTHTQTHTHTDILASRHLAVLSFSISLSQFLSLTHTHTHTHSSFLSLSPTHSHTSFCLSLPYLLSWQREKLLSAGWFHSEAVAHQRRSRIRRRRRRKRRRQEAWDGSDEWPWWHSEKAERRLRMTKSQSGEESSCLGLWCRRGRYHHSDHCAAENQPPVIPVIPVSVRLHQEATDRAAVAAVRKELCDSNDSLSLSLSLPICLFLSLSLSTPPSLSLSLFLLRPCLPAPAPSLCPRWLPDEGKLMPEFIVGLRFLPAPLHCSAQLCGGGAWRFKGTVNRTVPPLPRSSPRLLSAGAYTPSLSPLTLPISPLSRFYRGCYLSLKSGWSLPLPPGKRSLGTRCPKFPRLLHH